VIMAFAVVFGVIMAFAAGKRHDHQTPGMCMINRVPV